LEGGNMLGNSVTAAIVFENGENARQISAKQSDGTTGEKGDMMQSALFERVSARLKAQVGPDVFASWFGRLKLQSVSKSVVRLSVPTTFLKSWINNRYLDQITNIFQQEDAEILKVEIVVRSATRSTRPGLHDDAPQASHSDVAAPASSRRSTPQTLGQHAAATVGNLAEITTRCRPAVRLAAGFSLYIRELRRGLLEPRRPCSRQDDCRSWRRRRALQPAVHSFDGRPRQDAPFAGDCQCCDPECTRTLRVVYLTAEYFMWRFATAIRDNDALSLKETLRNIDLLIIDDMQFLQGKIDPARILPSPQYAARQRQAGRRCCRPRAVGAGIARSARPFASAGWRRHRDGRPGLRDASRNPQAPP
jgi:chromosomal replication initiator protein